MTHWCGERGWADRQMRGKDRAEKSESQQRQKDNGEGGVRNKSIIPLDSCCRSNWLVLVGWLVAGLEAG